MKAKTSDGREIDLDQTIVDTLRTRLRGPVMLDLSLMRGVWVDPRRTLARAHAGCVLGDVDRETPVRGLAAVPGFVSATGIAGPTLGGGFGYLTRRWRRGPTLSRADVVTADGRVVWASSDEHPDFFWGCAAAGGILAS